MTRLSEKIHPGRLVRRFAPIVGQALTPTDVMRAFGAPSFGQRFDHGSLPDSLGRIGSLEVRLARTAREVRLAQALRFAVFFEEMSARPDARTKLTRRDVDAFDAICDHLLVVDHDRLGPAGPMGRAPAVVGTYRLLRQEVAERHGGFYSEAEYQVGDLIARKRPLRFVELGRSCVMKAYRNRRTVELLWLGISAYINHHAVDVMVGCASLEGTDPDRLALPLSFLAATAAASEEWNVRAVPSRYVPMNRMPVEQIAPKAALQALPPLIKGYLRVGAMVGDGAVVDHQFGTTDVFMVLPVERIRQRYIDYFRGPQPPLS